MPIINAPPSDKQGASLFQPLKNLRIILPYTYLGQQTGIRIITADKEEILLIFKSEKQYEKSLKHL